MPWQGSMHKRRYTNDHIQHCPLGVHAQLHQCSLHVAGKHNGNTRHSSHTSTRMTGGAADHLEEGVRVDLRPHQGSTDARYADPVEADSNSPMSASTQPLRVCHIKAESSSLKARRSPCTAARSVSTHCHDSAYSREGSSHDQVPGPIKLCIRPSHGPATAPARYQSCCGCLRFTVPAGQLQHPALHAQHPGL